jgi:hypothetical protein
MRFGAITEAKNKQSRAQFGRQSRPGKLGTMPKYGMRPCWLAFTKGAGLTTFGVSPVRGIAGQEK